ncbi:MAG: LysR family transcriptional regulator [Pseudomonas sp.]|uniref:LysR family transcriptional regulator n=1 Tax=Pseudomonas abieticivorans TaxID=2931382 RepID=UPI0020BF1072|nr:LysR family transcriptional regulator [Pseudomonas sp. PIA16]MDE1169318.1 LysR family transcriptional regulator [Pseudomonas sp.]
MKLHQIKALVAINQCGSINEASQILHVTQPALSRSIKDLERELGLTLLQRSYKGMSLTEEGRRIIRHARMAVESMRRLQIEADNIHDMAVGEVAIGVTSLTAMLPGFDQCLADFQAKNQRVRMKVVEQRPSHIVQRLREGTLDFALTSQQNTQRLNLDWEALHRIQGAVTCSASNPLRHSRSLRQLQYANWISLDEVDDRSSQFYQMFEVNDIPAPPKVIECASMLLALRLIKSADAFMTISKIATAQNTVEQMAGLVWVDIEEVIPDYPIYLVCVDRHSLTSPARDLFYSLRARLTQEQT